MTNIGWRKTELSENENDYVAYDDGVYVGRVYLVTTSGTAPFWGAFFAGGGSARCDSRREAMMAVEEAWMPREL
ncbi:MULTISPECIES: hypothetical protein [unclassified Mesorhizobium]|uniref:hypothetical protein n=1 Tax=unclassified Mesorhizobium TaxID=325217 RepID=UPI000FD97618|nr:MULTISPECIES: hypothetical protein [unclassified Mesorhizobium]TGT76694.1 hypothetical protein EN809_003560 [Mesorhizobium sp. M2E.F.Ca.ET.166.01.1.1]TGW02806.1 hypothetical protein EN797_003560 [Mesorhizobium sp. M2E.F.Ca.ET.154.01.1.1]